ncbi:GPI-anchored surface protein, putative [Bodo saltans]|uniref:GPI-anchored surface protein, putative n=1 Tax=Bodo saltans TaxID=75058 RepID=A0A0S4JDI9_BODSA|nr:GPI-anchored surface protein, putative [Bodo saltans]|eukprot:CUG88220.1 GPI-anchored surface protein, putative [Bodo saltans]
MVDIVGAFLFFTWLLQVDAVPLQCANDSTTNLSSNIEYVMRDCNGPASPVLVARNGHELTNVTITVTNGNVLPRLRIMNHTAVRGLTVHIENVTWLATVNDTHRLQDATGVGATVLLSIRESAVTNVSVVILNCNLAITNSISAGVAPTNVVLLEVLNNENTFGRASNVSLAILNSTMNFTQVHGCCTARYNATGSSVINIFNDAADIQLVHITLQDVTVLLYSTYQRYFGPLLINSGGEKSLMSAATNVTVICSRALIIMRLTMCPTGCGVDVTMYGGLVYLQANSIRYFMMTVVNATMTLQPAVPEMMDRNAPNGTQLWASVAVIIPDNGNQSHVSHVVVVIMSSDFTIAATMGASLLNVGNFTEVNDTSLVAHALTTLMSANGRIIDDTAAMIRCSAIIICLAATVQRLDVAIDGVEITSVLAVGHPTEQLASLVPQLGVVAGAAMVLTDV